MKIIAALRHYQVTSFDPALDAPEYENEEEYEEGEGEYETEEEFNARQEQEGEYLEEEVIERTDDIESSTVEKSGVTDEGQIAQDQVEVEKIKDGSVVIPDIVESAIKSPIAEEILSKSEDKEKAVEYDWMGGVMNGYKSWASSIGKKWGATVDL